MANKYEHLARDNSELEGWKRKRLASWRRSCGRKRSYDTRAKADRSAKATTETNAKNGNDRVCRAYFCSFCGKYHVTSAPKKGE